MRSDPLHEVIVHCKGLLFDGQGGLLLVRQAESIGTYWNAPGGRMEEGDTLDTCLRREVQEETGLIVQEARLVYTHAFVSPGVTDLFVGYQVTRYSGQLGIGTSLTEVEQQEITDVRFVDPDEDLADPVFPHRLRDVANACWSSDLAGVEYLGTLSTDQQVY